MYSLETLQNYAKRNREGKLELNLSSQNLSTVPEAMSQLTQIQVLDLSGNTKITQLPPELNKLESLSCLRLSGCVSLKSFPPSQSFPPQLKELHVDRCGLTEIGTAITELCGLEKLHVSNNPIRIIPESMRTLVQLNELDCSVCQLTEVGEITELTGLEKLNLSGNPIKSVPKTIRLLALRELNLHDCGLTEMKSEITELTGLEKLDLSGNPIKSIPNTIRRLVALRELNLRDCGLTEMMIAITELTSLEKLDLSRNHIKSIPNMTRRLVALTELNLQYCGLTEMKSEITELTGLEKLDLSFNLIKSIPNTIRRLTALGELNLQYCGLTEMKSEITELTGLEKLDLSGNHIKNISNTIRRLIALRELNLGYCGLTEMKSEITELTGLQKLGLSGNHIKSIPNTIGRMVALRELNCRYCGLTEMEIEITGLTSLKKLDFSWNPIKSIPNTLGRLFVLRELNLQNCGLPEMESEITELTGLEKLDLSRNPIKSIPNTIRRLIALKELSLQDCGLTKMDEITKLKFPEKLDLSSNPLKSIPNTISRLVTLRELNLHDCGLTEMESEITKLTGLRKLDLSLNPIKTIPNTIRRLVALRELNLHDCGLTEMKSEITELTRLEKLYLSRNYIKSTPITIRLVALRELNLQDCALTEMKSEITELTGLEKLDLSRNTIKSIPNTIRKLFALRELNLQNSGLTEMKNEITELTGLEKLNLSGNRIKSIPNTIRRLVSLAELNLRYCGLTEMKTEITELTGLERLDLSRNPIESIPNVVHKLKSLKDLNLSWCNLQGVPQSIFNMKSLKSLNLEGNQLREVPVGIVDFKCWLDYEELKLTGNPLVLPPKNVCSQGSKAMFKFLQEWRELAVHMKVVLVGSSSAGKTSLVRTLASGKPSLVEEDDRTVVLERSNWELCNEQCNVHIKFVDFGGQEWYRVVHPFFLDEDALILLAVNLGTYSRDNFDKDVGNWLHVLESRVPKATVRFVLTQADQVDKLDATSKIAEIQQLALQDKCGDVPQHVRVVSSKTMENIKELQEEIVHFAVKKGRKIPSSWLSLYREMCLSDDAKRKKFLVMKDVKRMFKMMTKKTYNVVSRMLKKTEERCRDVLSFLHSIGIIAWYDHPVELSNYVFHRPEYFAELVKAIFAEHHSTDSLSYKKAAFNTKFSSAFFKEEKQSLQQRGVMSRALLSGLWEHMKLDEELFNEMTQLLVKLDLCCVLSSNEDGDVDKLMFPCFLKEAAGPEVNQVLQSAPSLGCYRLTLEYLFVTMCPPLLCEKLAVRMHHHIQDADSRRDWKDGVLARIFNSRVVVQRRTDGGETVISIAVEGKDPVELWKVLLSLKEDMTSLMVEWPGVRFERWLVCPHCVQSAVKQPHKFPGIYMEKKILSRQLWMKCPHGGFDVPACLVYPVRGSKKDIQHHLDLLLQFTCNLKHCIPCKQNSDGFTDQSANVGTQVSTVGSISTELLPDEEMCRNPSAVPTLSVLKELSKEIIPQWQFLGLQLDMNQATIDNIAYNNVMFPCPEQKAFQMLKSCWDMGSSSTYDKLADALRREGLGRLADKYCCGA